MRVGFGGFLAHRLVGTGQLLQAFGEVVVDLLPIRLRLRRGDGAGRLGLVDGVQPLLVLLASLELLVEVFADLLVVLIRALPG